MAADCRGWAYWRTGWTGTVTVNDGGGASVLAVTGSASAWRQAQYLDGIGPAYLSWTVRSNGAIQFFGSSSFTLAFSSSALATRLGYSSTSYLSSTSHVAESVAPGVFHPYGNDGCVWVGEVAHHPGSGRPLTSQSYWNHGGALDWQNPRLWAKVQRDQELRAIEQMAYMDSPCKASVLTFSGSTPSLTTVFVNAVKTQAHDRRGDGWFTVELDVMEA